MADRLEEDAATHASEASGETVDERLYVRRRADVETAILPDGSCLLFDPATNNGHALNASGALIWECCDGTLSAGNVADELAELLPREAEIRDQALNMIVTLLRQGLLLPVSERDDR
jgi:Coenzyme PQQ synthesis protein D (PqqD)